MATIARGNGYDPAGMRYFVEAIEQIEKEKESILLAAVASCRPLTKRIRDIIDDAWEQGCNRRALKGVIKARRHEGKAAQVREHLPDEEARDAYDLMRLALGEDVAPRPPEEAAEPAADDDDDRPDFLKRGVKPAEAVTQEA